MRLLYMRTSTDPHAHLTDTHIRIPMTTILPTYPTLPTYLSIYLPTLLLLLEVDLLGVGPQRLAALHDRLELGHAWKLDVYMICIHLCG